MKIAKQAMPILWIIITLACIVAALHAYFHNRPQQANLFGLLSVISLLMYFLRKHNQTKQDSEK